MPTPVRVIGRVDVADQVRGAVQSAGFDAELVTAAPRSVYGANPPAEGVDVVIATSMFDPPLWRLAKARHPSRPMVAVAERRREGALRGAVLRRNGPDAWVTWPATPGALAAAIGRAEASASRRRSWSAADLRAALLLGGLMTMGITGPAGALVTGVALLLGLRYAWSVRWEAIGGVVLTALGAGGVAVRLAQWIR